MTDAANLQRRFSVHDLEEAARRAHVVEGLSFEDAALHFADQFYGDGEMSLDIEDLETGERQRLRVDMESGRAEMCG